MSRNVVPMVVMTAALAVAGVVPNGSSVAANENSAAERTREQQAWKVSYDAAGTPNFVAGVQVAKKGLRPEEAALSFLEEQRSFFKMSAPRAQFKVQRVDEDALGMTHVRLQQTKHGLPVEGAVMLVHLDRTGTITGVNGHFDVAADQAVLSTTAAVTAEQALVTAKGAVQAPDELDYVPTTELVVTQTPEAQPVTAWKVNLNFLGEMPGNWYVYVDAQTGAVVDQVNALMDVHDAAHGPYHPGHASGIGVHGAHRVLNVSHQHDPVDGNGQTFYLLDQSKPGMDGIRTYDFKNLVRSRNWALPGVLFADKDAAWHDEYQRPAVDAHYNSERVYDYYLHEHGRNSIDGNGMAIISTVHYGKNYNNAFWNGFQMTYGDGDGKFFIPLSAALDVAAHEMTHGVTTHTANLQYRNESGALNEAFSDIFGALVDDDDWECGEDAMAPEAIASGRTALRSLSDPNKFPVNASYVKYGNGSGVYPKHMNEFYRMPTSADNGGVHVNSSIINHAAYLTGIEIGREALGKVYYRALTVYLTPKSNFQDARQALVQAAIDLYGADSVETAGVIHGLEGVGL